MDVIGEVGRLFQHFSFPVSRPAAGKLGHAAIEARTERVSKSSYSLGSKQVGDIADRRHAFGCIRTRTDEHVRC